MNYITEKISFNVPQNGGHNIKCMSADQIADLLICI